MADFIHTLLSVLAPYTCLQCKKRGQLVCSDCASLLIPSPYYHESNLASLFLYQQPLVKKLIWQFKYRGQKQAANWFADSLADIILGEFLERSLIDQQINQIVLVPTPATRLHQFLRGYNQTLILAQKVAEKLNHQTDTPVTVNQNLVRKIKWTKSQAKTKSLTERKVNLRDAFKALDIPRPATTRTLYIIVDDVLTSGATLAEVAKTLRKAGARHIFQLAVAFQEKI